MEPSVAELRQMLVLAIDDVDVACDYLRNLLGPTGPDVEARFDALPAWRKAWNGFGALRERSGGAGIPQGDQLRRALGAVDAAAASMSALADVSPPREALPRWETMMQTLVAGRLVEVVASAHGTARVSADLVRSLESELRTGAVAMHRCAALLGAT